MFISSDINKLSNFSFVLNPVKLFKVNCRCKVFLGLSNNLYLQKRSKKLVSFLSIFDTKEFK